jgi:hypothetical protein
VVAAITLAGIERSVAPLVALAAVQVGGGGPAIAERDQR